MGGVRTILRTWLAVAALAGGCATAPAELQRAENGGGAAAGAEDSRERRAPARSDGAAKATSAGAAGLRFVREAGHGLPGVYYGSVVVTDLDGDGKPDVVLAGNFDTVFDSQYHGDADAQRLSDRVRLYKNVSARGGPIRFELVEERRDLHGARGSLVVAGDFDGDGRRDLAVEVRNGDDLAALLNRGGEGAKGAKKGTAAWRFEKTVLERGFANNSTSLGMVATDVDQDGRDDLVFLSDGGGTGTALWYSYDPKTKVWSGRQRGYPHAMGYGGAIAAGDLDGDGFPDLVVSGNSRAPFGSHQCANLMIGEAVRNLGVRGAAAGFEVAPLAVLGNFGLRQPADARGDTRSCHGMDNGGLLVADLDRDRKNDVVVAGSMTGLDGPPGRNGQQYDLAVLFNADGRGRDFAAWENVGPQDEDGTTNGGAGNVDFPNLAVGDLDGDGLPEILVEGHRRDYAVRFDVNGDGVDKDNPYVFADQLLYNDGDRSFTEVSLEPYVGRFGPASTLPKELGFLAGRPRWVGEGGVAIADLDGDGKNDLLLTGAELPFHTNGANARDHNTTATLTTLVLRNVGER